MDNNQNNENKEVTTAETAEDQPKVYTAEEKKEIRLHWAGLFIVFYLVLSLSAMKSLISYYPIVGYGVCLFLAGLVSYFMSFTMYGWVKKKGWSVYLIVLVVIVLMLARY